MDGAQHVQGYIGYGPIPNKQQPEPVYTGVNPQGKRVSPWPEKWEGTFTPCYAATATAFETGFPGPDGQPIRPPPEQQSRHGALGSRNHAAAQLFKHLVF